MHAALDDGMFDAEEFGDARLHVCLPAALRSSSNSGDSRASASCACIGLPQSGHVTWGITVRPQSLPPTAEEHLAQEHERPLVANDLEGAGNGAGLRGKIGAAHSGSREPWI